MLDNTYSRFYMRGCVSGGEAQHLILASQTVSECLISYLDFCVILLNTVMQLCFWPHDKCTGGVQSWSRSSAALLVSQLSLLFALLITWIRCIKSVRRSRQGSRVTAVKDQGYPSPVCTVSIWTAPHILCLTLCVSSNLIKKGNGQCIKV